MSARSWTIEIRDFKGDEWRPYESSSDGHYLVAKLRALRADGAQVRLSIVDGPSESQETPNAG